MQIVESNAEARLLELVRALRGDPTENYALHFHLSGLQEENRSDFQLKIATNILNDIFRESDGTILACEDGDTFVVYHGTDRVLLEKAVFQLRYLFVDDPLATHSDGSENEDFCTMFDLTFQWRPFNRLCTERIEEMRRRESEILFRPEQKSQTLDPEALVEIIEELETTNISAALRMQAVSAKKVTEDIRMVFQEIYVNIGHLGELLDAPYNLAGDKDLFKYITRQLDVFVLETLQQNADDFLQKPISINLNLSTVLSDPFKEFTSSIGAMSRSIVIEVHVADLFSDMYAFGLASEFAQEHGYRICLDGLTNLSFIQVDRASLGFDLAKLQWNADMASDLDKEDNQVLAQAIKRCGSNRMILCRCDSVHAIDYGHALGISLFQGRYPDKLLDPDSSIVN